jgi:hypothetical protein
LERSRQGVCRLDSQFHPWLADNCKKNIRWSIHHTIILHAFHKVRDFIRLDQTVLLKNAFFFLRSPLERFLLVNRTFFSSRLLFKRGHNCDFLSPLLSLICPTCQKMLPHLNNYIAPGRRERRRNKNSHAPIKSILYIYVRYIFDNLIKKPIISET